MIVKLDPRLLRPIRSETEQVDRNSNYSTLFLGLRPYMYMAGCTVLVMLLLNCISIIISVIILVTLL